MNDIYPKTWTDYVKSLEKFSQRTKKKLLESTKWYPKYLKQGDKDPWRNTLEKAADVILEKNKNWTECRKILYGTGGCYMLFGRVPLGGINFINDANHRKKVLSILKSFKEENFSEKTPEEMVEIVLRYYDQLDALPSTGGAVASRFLALTRPDVAVSYNGKSKEYFCNLRELGKGVKGDREGYKQAQLFVYNQVWYNSPEPKNQKSIWQNRAALIDIIAYATCPSDKHQKSKSNASSITSDYLWNPEQDSLGCLPSRSHKLRVFT